MDSLFINSLFISFPSKYQSLKSEVKKFNTIYNGNTIIQDNIFQVMENYCKRNNKKLNIVKLPTSDENLTSFSCIRNGEIFIVLNSMMPQNKLIISGAHELYHILCYITGKNNYLLINGSLITTYTLNDVSVDSQQMNANEFARLLLVSPNSLLEQIEVYGIDKNNISNLDCLKLMDIFAVPYKTIVTRLLEESIVSEYKAKKLLDIDDDKIDELFENFNISHKWNKHNQDLIHLCGLEELLLTNSINNALPESRINGDLEFVHQTFDRVNNLVE
jgi:Zn-dependent peptidase ImmA (M78 family)